MRLPFTLNLVRMLRLFVPVLLLVGTSMTAQILPSRALHHDTLSIHIDEHQHCFLNLLSDVENFSTCHIYRSTPLCLLLISATMHVILLFLLPPFLRRLLSCRPLLSPTTCTVLWCLSLENVVMTSGCPSFSTIRSDVERWKIWSSQRLPHSIMASVLATSKRCWGNSAVRMLERHSGSLPSTPCCGAPIFVSCCEAPDDWARSSSLEREVAERSAMLQEVSAIRSPLHQPPLQCQQPSKTLHNHWKDHNLLQDLHPWTHIAFFFSEQCDVLERISLTQRSWPLLSQ